MRGGVFVKYSIQIETSKLSRQIAWFAEVTKKELSVALAENGSIVASRLMHNTNPYGLDKKTFAKIKNSVVGDIVGRKSDATNNVKRSALFHGAKLSTLRKWKREYGDGKTRLWVRKDGTVYGTEATLYKPDASFQEMRDHHKKFFKNGQRSRAGNYTRDIGRWKFIDKMVVGAGALKSYIEKMVQRVGFTKAGWATAAQRAGFKLNASGRNYVPKWISRHAGTAPGTGRMGGKGTSNPFFVLVNQVPWASTKIRLDDIGKTLADARQDIIKRVDAIIAAENRKLK